MRIWGMNDGDLIRESGFIFSPLSLYLSSSPCKEIGIHPWRFAEQMSARLHVTVNNGRMLLSARDASTGWVTILSDSGTCLDYTGNRTVVVASKSSAHSSFKCWDNAVFCHHHYQNWLSAILAFCIIIWNGSHATPPTGQFPKQFSMDNPYKEKCHQGTYHQNDSQVGQFPLGLRFLLVRNCLGKVVQGEIVWLGIFQGAGELSGYLL